MSRRKRKKRLEKKQKLFIIVGSVLLVVFGLSVYVNHQLDTFIKAWNSVGTPIAGTGEPGPQDPGNKDPDDPEDPGGSSWSFERQPSENKNEEDLPSFEDIARDVQARVNRPVEKTDMLRVGLILVRRLDRSEITYLYNVGKRGTYSPEEVNKTRRILTSKLTEHDLEVLQEMAEKYEQPLFFME